MGRDSIDGSNGTPPICFNPRARMGRDCHIWLLQVLRMSFQSTRPHGARPFRPGLRLWLLCFNPRARMGRDALFNCKQDTITGFNPRARMGRDSDTSVNSLSPTSFNPRARMGRDNAVMFKRPIPGVFQSTRPHGARLYHRSCPVPGSLVCFNPRARMGRDIDFKFKGGFL